MTGKTIDWHSDDVAEPSHDDVLHGVAIIVLCGVSLTETLLLAGAA